MKGRCPVRALVVGNRGDDDAGFVGDRLSFHGFEFDCRSREMPGALATGAENVDLVVLLGSDWSVYDPSVGPEVRAELSLVQRTQARGVPMLGICFGGQLVSKALGLAVEHAPIAEIGWHEVTSEGPGLFASGRWFQYHLDRWSDSSEHPAFARSMNAPQAYWYGRTLALQFHPEVTEQTVERWCGEGHQALNALGVDLGQVLSETAQLIGESEHRCHDLVDRFLDQAATRSYPEMPMPLLRTGR